MNLTWKYVLVCKSFVGRIDRLYGMALALGYEYFLWNDHVYHISIGGGLST